ncbi:MAG: hypothetical protein JW395_1691 [Nitrospira sp.]|nr:hypothetical protein [Nitrospira sp.]
MYRAITIVRVDGVEAEHRRQGLISNPRKPRQHLIVGGLFGVGDGPQCEGVEPGDPTNERRHCGATRGYDLRKFLGPASGVPHNGSLFDRVEQRSPREERPDINPHRVALLILDREEVNGALGAGIFRQRLLEFVEVFVAEIKGSHRQLRQRIRQGHIRCKPHWVFFQRLKKLRQNLVLICYERQPEGVGSHIPHARRDKAVIEQRLVGRVHRLRWVLAILAGMDKCRQFEYRFTGFIYAGSDPESLLPGPGQNPSKPIAGQKATTLVDAEIILKLLLDALEFRLGHGAALDTPIDGLLIELALVDHLANRHGYIARQLVHRYTSEQMQRDKVRCRVADLRRDIEHNLTELPQLVGLAQHAVLTNQLLCGRTVLLIACAELTDKIVVD